MVLHPHPKHLELEASRWQIINDGVMGGISRSEVVVHESRLVFRGQLSLENNGGFASARCHFEQEFGGVSGFRLHVRGDGRNYQFRLRADELPEGIAWRASFSTDGSQQLIDLPLAAFEPVIRGRKVEHAGELNPGDIHLLGLMLADAQAGPFALEIYSIEAQRARIAAAS